MHITITMTTAPTSDTAKRELAKLLPSIMAARQQSAVNLALYTAGTVASCEMEGRATLGRMIGTDQFMHDDFRRIATSAPPRIVRRIDIALFWRWIIADKTQHNSRSSWRACMANPNIAELCMVLWESFLHAEYIPFLEKFLVQRDDLSVSTAANLAAQSYPITEDSEALLLRVAQACVPAPSLPGERSYARNTCCTAYTDRAIHTRAAIVRGGAAAGGDV
jgi:hypothetical protein